MSSIPVNSSAGNTGTRLDGFDAIVAVLWCSHAFLCRLINFMNRWHEVMEGKKEEACMAM